MKPLLTIPEVMGILRIDKSTAYEWIRTGKLPAVRLEGRVRVDPDELQRWIEERRTA